MTLCSGVCEECALLLLLLQIDYERLRAERQGQRGSISSLEAEVQRLTQALHQVGTRAS